jgi:hypothetical protein
MLAITSLTCTAIDRLDSGPFLQLAQANALRATPAGFQGT